MRERGERADFLLNSIAYINGSVFTGKRKTPQLVRRCFMEVPPGFEPGNEGFADLCLTTWLWHQIKNGAVDETRTRDLHLGKVALYQLSYYRMKGVKDVRAKRLELLHRSTRS